MSDSFSDIVYAPHLQIMEKVSLVENKLGSPEKPGWDERAAAYLAFKKELDGKADKINQLGFATDKHEGNVNALRAEIRDFASGVAIADLRKKFTSISDAMQADATKLEKGGESARYLSNIYDMLADIEAKYGDPRLADERTKSRDYWQNMLDAAADYPSKKTSLVQFVRIYAASLKPDFDARIAYEEQVARDTAQQAFNKTVQNLGKGIGHSIVAPEKASFARKPRPPGAA